MKVIIPIVAMVCGTALLIAQFLHEDPVIQGGPAFCEYIGVGMCLAGVVMGFIVVGLPSLSDARRPAAV